MVFVCFFLRPMLAGMHHQLLNIFCGFEACVYLFYRLYSKHMKIWCPSNMVWDVSAFWKSTVFKHWIEIIFKYIQTNFIKSLRKQFWIFFIPGANKPATIIVRVGNNRPDLGTNPICNRFTGFLEEGQPLFLPCNPPMPGAFVSVHLESPTSSQLSICEAFVYTDQALPIERCPQFRDQPPGMISYFEDFS